MINISKTDVLWNYIAQFFSLASGLITLPLILKMLTVEEIALNYIFLTVSSLVLLFDFGFSPQFSRNVSYVYGGAQTLKKEGFFFKKAFTSYLKRAVKTLNTVIDQMDLDRIPVEKSRRLNEKHYGTLQGLNKAETAEKY